MRSAKPPTISAGVMIAKVSWNITNTVSGMVPTTLSAPTPLNQALPNPPTSAPTAPLSKVML